MFWIFIKKYSGFGLQTEIFEIKNKQLFSFTKVKFHNKIIYNVIFMTPFVEQVGVKVLIYSLLKQLCKCI